MFTAKPRFFAVVTAVDLTDDPAAQVAANRARRHCNDMNDDTHTPLKRSIVLIGLMGAGKSSIGRRLAKCLGMPFFDADQEIETAAGCSVAEIFEVYGEPAFRDVEEKVINRLLNDEPCVLATGGGAYMNPRTRQQVAVKGVSVWLRASLDVLFERTGRRKGRPLLDNADRRETLSKLIAERYPVYEAADIVIETGSEGIEVTTARVLDALNDTKPSGTRAPAPC